MTVCCAFTGKCRQKRMMLIPCTDCQRSLLKSFRLSPPNRALNTQPKALNTNKTTIIAIISSITFSYSNELYTIMQVHHFQPVLSGFLHGVERTALV